MRIAIPSESGEGLGSRVSEHFGRTKYFTIVDVVDGELARVAVISNPLQHHSYGELPQLLKAHGVDVVLACRMGPRAQDYLEKLGIKVALGFCKSVGDAVREYISAGKLSTL